MYDWTASLSYVLLNGILVYSYTFVSFDKEKFDILNVCLIVVSFLNVKFAEVFFIIISSWVRNIASQILRCKEVFIAYSVS